VNPLFFAKASAVLSVVYAGVNVMQLWSGYPEVKIRAEQFAQVAADPVHAARLRTMRFLFYVALPLLFLGTFLGAELPVVFLLAAFLKFWTSAFLGLATERRLLQGQEYRARDHRLSRFDALLNISMAVGTILLLLGTRY